MASNGSASTEQENNLAYLLDQGKVKILRELKTSIERVNDLNLFQPGRWGRTSLMIACLQGSIVKHRIPYSLMTIPTTCMNQPQVMTYY